jgi:hypothetical protein
MPVINIGELYEVVLNTTGVRHHSVSRVTFRRSYPVNLLRRAVGPWNVEALKYLVLAALTQSNGLYATI